MENIKERSNNGKSFSNTLKIAFLKAFNKVFFKKVLITVLCSIALGAVIVAFMHDKSWGFITGGVVLYIGILTFFANCEESTKAKTKLFILGICFPIAYLLICYAFGWIFFHFMTLYIPEAKTASDFIIFASGVGITFFLMVIVYFLEKDYVNGLWENTWKNIPEYLMFWLRRLLLIGIFISIIFAMIFYIHPLLLN